MCHDEISSLSAKPNPGNIPVFEEMVPFHPTANIKCLREEKKSTLKSYSFVRLARTLCLLSVSFTGSFSHIIL